MSTIEPRRIPPPVAKAITQKIVNFSVPLIAIPDRTKRGHLGGCGTLVTSQSRFFILTAAHVWAKALASAELVWVVLSDDGLGVSLPTDASTVLEIGGGENLEWGPDLAFIEIPNVVAKMMEHRKSFYNLDKRENRSLNAPCDFGRGGVVVVGAPDIRTSHERKFSTVEITAFFSAVEAVHERRGFDYVDIRYKPSVNPDLPRELGGVSGGGLWHVDLRDESGTVVWHDRASSLEGVAYFHHVDGDEPIEAIRCHGRRSIYDKGLGAVRRSKQSTI